MRRTQKLHCGSSKKLMAMRGSILGFARGSGSARAIPAGDSFEFVPGLREVELLALFRSRTAGKSF